jgi:hypothetical protein
MKWYVNLPAETNRGRAENHGQAITLKATRDFTDWFSANLKASWTLAWQPKTHDGYFLKDPSFVHGTVTGEDGDAFTNQLAVPPTGGITYEVTAQKAPGQGDASVVLKEQFEAWRIMYYKVEYMNPRCKALFESIEPDFKQAFADAFIELKEKGTRERCKGDDEPVTVRSGDVTLTDKHAGSLERAPYHLRILLINDVAEKMKKHLELVVKNDTNTDDVKVAGGIVRIRTGETVARFVRDFEVKTLVVKPDSASSVVPGKCIEFEPSTHSTIRVDPATEELRTAVEVAADKGNVTYTVKVTGGETTRPFCRKIPASRKNDGGNAVPIPNGRFWFEGERLVLEAAAGKMLSDRLGAVVAFGATLIPMKVADRTQTRAILAPSSDEDSYREKLMAGNEASVDFDFYYISTSPTQQTRRVTVRTTDLLQNGERCSATLFGMGRLQMMVNDFHVVQVDEMTVATAETLDVSKNAHHLGLASFSADASELSIDMSKPEFALALTALAAGRNVDISLEYEWKRSSGGYHKTGSDVLVLTTLQQTPGEAVERTKKRMLLVACHETGHALGLARASQKKKGGLNEANALYYKGHGGQGPHCSLNTKAEPCPALDEKTKFVPDDTNNPLCIMYHTLAGLDRAGLRFCDVCRNHLIRNEVKIS